MSSSFLLLLRPMDAATLSRPPWPVPAWWLMASASSSVPLNPRWCFPGSHAASFHCAVIYFYFISPLQKWFVEVDSSVTMFEPIEGRYVFEFVFCELTLKWNIGWLVFQVTQRRLKLLGVPTMAQRLKDPVLALLWCRFDPWPGNFHILQVWQKKIFFSIN